MQLSFPLRLIELTHSVCYCSVNSTNTKAPKKPYHQWHKFTIHFTTDVVTDVTEEVLQRLCNPFGDIGDTVVRSHVPLNAPEVGIAGYAVVFYLELASAQRAFEYLNKTTVNHITFTCSFSTNPQPINAIPRRAQNPNAMMGHNNGSFHGHPGSQSRIQTHASANAQRGLSSSPPLMMLPPSLNVTRTTSPPSAASCNSGNYFQHTSPTMTGRTSSASPSSLSSFSTFSEAPDHLFTHLHRIQPQSQPMGGNANGLFHPHNASLFQEEKPAQSFSGLAQSSSYGMPPLFQAQTSRIVSTSSASSVNSSGRSPSASFHYNAPNATQGNMMFSGLDSMSSASSSTTNQQGSPSLFDWLHNTDSTPRSGATYSLWSNTTDAGNSADNDLSSGNDVPASLPLSLSFMLDSANTSGKHTAPMQMSASQQFEQLLMPSASEKRTQLHKHHGNGSRTSSASTSSVSSMDSYQEQDDYFLETPISGTMPGGFFIH